MNSQRANEALSEAARRCVALKTESIRLKEDGDWAEATAVLEKAEKLQGQITALERALQAWRRY
jgi:hypothetical protein